MMRTLPWPRALLVLLPLLILAGCGGGGGNDTTTPPGDDTITQGDFTIQTAATASFRTVALETTSSRYSFLGFHGAAIRRLTYQPQLGNWLYTRPFDGPADLYHSRPDGSGEFRLTNDGPTQAYARWSVDGQSVAVVEREGAGPSSIRIMNRNGGGSHLLLLPPDLATPIGVVWGPYDNLYFACERVGGYSLFRARPDGTQVYDLCQLDRLYHNLDISPNGTDFVGWWSGDGNSSGIALIRTQSGDIHELLPASELASFPRFSPDGSKIVYMSQKTGNWEVWVMDSAGAGRRQLTNHAAMDMAPLWAPDGSRILWSRQGDLWSMAPDGSGQTLVKAGLGVLWDWWGSNSGIGGPGVAAAAQANPASYFYAPPTRTVIGPAGSDYGGLNPPLGGNRPLCLVGFGVEGLTAAVSANLTGTPSSAAITPLTGLAGNVTAGQITAPGIERLLIDQGAGQPVQLVSFSPAAGSVIVLFDNATGRFQSAIVVQDQAYPAALTTEQDGTDTILRGPVRNVYEADAQGRIRDLAPAGARSVRLQHNRLILGP